ncbi:hypothetical protein UFOVP347_43 [uncultured Caudovirales phage]|uniref:Gene product 88 domain-containing protein n=1 Tax=uncultured Caudovirales phage TaxID=2100421 RepID=A0A6J5M2K3_9CAUD|nr:hypothetical protein UFOVP347_43 [uncultured Caudovirales phage]
MTTPRFKLLTMGNPKTAKGRAKGWAVAVLHLAPASLSGFNVCPQSTAGCIAGCLNLAGRGGLAAGGALTLDDVMAGKRSNVIQAARVRRTEWLFDDRAGFLAALTLDIQRFVQWCQREGLKPALRLNGTSDLDWNGIAPGVISMCNLWEVQRYDYTKVANRAKRSAPGMYALTFSLAESNDADALRALDGGMNVAAVFSTPKGKPLPETYTIAGRVIPVIDGDEDDLRFLDPAGVIVGLRAKGPAKRDTSGFVRRV